MKTPKTLTSEFIAGLESGKHPCAQNDEKALLAIVRKSTSPLVRAYWSGYFCQSDSDRVASASVIVNRGGQLVSINLPC
jgi:hypothetical protein